jgi:hypothetical protein
MSMQGLTDKQYTYQITSSKVDSKITKFQTGTGELYSNRDMSQLSKQLT